MNKKFLFVIPARSGSKGVTNKNIRLVREVPLIEYTLKSIENFDRKNMTAVVSSDSMKILEISKSYDVEQLLRPKELSGDNSKTVDVILQILDHFENKGLTFSYTVLLQPTSPLRNEIDINNSIEHFLKSDKLSLISVYILNGVKETYIYKETSKKSFVVENNAGLPGTSLCPTTLIQDRSKRVLMI